MSITLNEIAYSVAETVGKPYDESFLNRVRTGIHYYRSLLIKREIDRNPGFIPPQFVQRLSCVEMEEVDIAECPEVVELGCKICRTKEKVPTLVRLADRLAIKYVGTIDLKKNYSMISVDRIPWMKFNLYTANKPFAYFLDDYIYIGNACPERITIMGVFEDPTALTSFVGCDGERSFTFDDPYPIPRDMVQRLIQAMLAGEFGLQQGSNEEAKEIQVSDTSRS